MKRFLVLCAFAILAGSATAETVVTPQAFEDMSTGKTMYFSRDGQPFGAEQYYQNRESKWRFGNEECVEGLWFARQDEICFVYKNQPIPQCWTFLTNDGRFIARPSDGGEEFDLSLEAIDTEELFCPGPAVGV